MERAKLIAARGKKYWTLEEAASRLDVCAATIYKWEQGRAAPRPRHIRALCKLYGVAAWELGLDEPPEAQEPAVPPQAPVLQEASLVEYIGGPESEEKDASESASFAPLFQQDLKFRLLCLIYQQLHQQQLSYAMLQVMLNAEIERD